jgi:hypothetical protein
MDEWSQEDQDKAVAVRRDLAAKIQNARRDGRPGLAWCYDKIANMVLWVERQGKRLMRGF